MTTSLLIANRGEIECRAIRTARRLGIRMAEVRSVPDVRIIVARFLAFSLALVGAALSGSVAFAGTRDEAETQLLERSIRAAAHACVAGRPTDALAGLDHDFLLTFPNSPTQDYAGMVRDYGNLCKRSGENTLESSVPVFEEVAVNGDIGIARLQWSTHLRGAPKESVRRLGELQVWRRTPDGWRLWRSARWPLRAPASR